MITPIPGITLTDKQKKLTKTEQTVKRVSTKKQKIKANKNIGIVKEAQQAYLASTSAAQTERQSKASADNKIKLEHNSSFDSIIDAAISPEKPENDSGSVIASRSIDSFKLKPEFIGTANKDKKGLAEFNSNLQQLEND